MAGPNLTAWIRVLGIDKANAELKALEAQGDKTAAAISGRGQGGGSWLQKNAAGITALSAGYLALSAAIQPAIRWMGEAAQAAREDEASIVRRNAALQNATGYTKSLNAELDAQADMYSKVFGISDDYTREIQTQYSAIGANAQSVEQLTTATLALAKVTGTDATTATIKITKFMEGQTNTIKGTTIAVEKNADEQDRWAAVMEYVQTGLKMMNDELDTGQGAVNRYKEASSELKEAWGKIGSSQPVIDAINGITDALIVFKDWVDRNGGAIVESLQEMGLLPGPRTYTQADANAADRNRTNAGILDMMHGPPKFDKKPGGGGGRKRGGGGGGRAAITPRADILGMSAYYIDALQAATAMGPDFGMESYSDQAHRMMGRNWALGRQMRRRRGRGTINAPEVYEHPYDFMIFGAEGGNDYPGSWATERLPGTPMRGWWDRKGGDITSIAGGLMSGGLGGGLSAAGSIAGNAILPGLGGLLGGLLGGGLGKLFGHKKKQQRDGQTNATAFIFQSPQLEDIRVAILRIAPQLRASGAGTNSTVRQIAMQSAR